MIWIWLAVFVVCLIIEALTLDLLSVWFSLGALVALAVAATTDLAYYHQILVFVLSSAVLLAFTRPILKKLLKNQERKTNVDGFIGKDVCVLDDISKYEAGTVKLSGIIYQAILPEGEDDLIKSGEIVSIIAIKGNKVVVRKK